MTVETGFFVKIAETEYLGPFNRLKEARDTARSISLNQEIYHGVLTVTDSGFDTNDLHLIPKIK
jgi:hypothetical protein